MENVTLLAPGGAAEPVYKDGLNEGVILAESQNFARSMINEPANVLTPTEFGRRAAAMAKENGLACEVYSTDKLRELKMGAFLGVLAVGLLLTAFGTFWGAEGAGSRLAQPRSGARGWRACRRPRAG